MSSVLCLVCCVLGVMSCVLCLVSSLSCLVSCVLSLVPCVMCHGSCIVCCVLCQVSCVLSLSHSYTSDIFMLYHRCKQVHNCDMRTFRLRFVEKEFLRTILDATVNAVQMQDKKRCCEYAYRAILRDKKMLEKAAAVLRPVVLAKIKSASVPFFSKLLDRHGPYLSLPKPLRGKGLETTARLLGLVTRVKMAKVDVATVKDECTLARGRLQMNMRGEIGRECKRVVIHKTKKKECIKRIVMIAQITGAANITLVWREFSSCRKTMVEVALEAIAAVCRLKNVYVLDIHKQTYLFAFPIFQKMLQLLTNSCIFAINMGEDDHMLSSPHFQLLAAKIADGSVALRRWYVESNPQRRVLLVTYKLVSKVRSTATLGNAQTPNVWTIARRCDKELWKQGQRDHARLSWLHAPQWAYDSASTYKTNMQDSTCNWSTACALREDAEKL